MWNKVFQATKAIGDLFSTTQVCVYTNLLVTENDYLAISDCLGIAVGFVITSSDDKTNRMLAILSCQNNKRFFLLVCVKHKLGCHFW